MSFKEDVRELLEYAEKKHWDECGYDSPLTEALADCTMQRITKVLDVSDAVEEVGKCWILVGTYRGLVDPDPQVFFHEKPALKARSAMDQKLGIKRKKGDYKHDENTCTLYEVEIK